MRVKSELWVRAYLRRCQSEGAAGVIARRGDPDAGAIFVCVNLLDGTACLYRPAPAGVPGTETERRWEACFDALPAASAEIDVYLGKQARFDPDLWIVEIDDRKGRHFLDDALL